MDETKGGVENKKNIVSVTGNKGKVYQVDINAKTCTCPAFTFRGGFCKHIKQVCNIQ